MLTTDQILVMGINIVSDEMVEMRYQYKEEFVEEYGRTNVVIAAYTTAQARLSYSASVWLMLSIQDSSLCCCSP
jgi:hypothetical protein